MTCVSCLLERRKRIFAFTVDDDGQEWEERDDGTTPTIKKVSGLYDVSLVTVGAYEDASVAIRSLDELKSEVAKESVVPKPCIALRRATATAKAALALAEEQKRKSN